MSIRHQVESGAPFNAYRDVRMDKVIETNAPTGRVDRNWTESGGKAP